MKRVIYLLFTLFAFSVAGMSQIRVQGNVSDTFNEPIPGVNVYIEGTTQGTISNVDGSYILDKVPEDGVIVFSSIGMKNQKIPVNGKLRIDVVMEEDVASLDEVVIIGYGSVKKRDLTGAVTSVKSDDILLTPTSNPAEALQGMIAGFDITKESGQAGAGVKMLLRGTRSLTETANTPLFIIDGMPGDYSTLNPNDINSIEVLKDASSTAIYGASGANGVVIITTKEAKSGRPVVNFNSYLGFNGFSSFPESRTGESYLNLRREAARTIGTWSSAADDASIFSTEEYAAIQDGKWVDWADLIMHNGYTQNYSLSVSGGSENTKAYFSFNLSDEEGIYKNDDCKVYSLHSNIVHDFSNWLSSGVTTQFSYTDRNARRGVLNKALTAVPLGEPYNDEGDINQYPIAGSESYGPMSDEIENAYVNETRSSHLTLNGFFEIKPLKGFSLKSILGVNISNSRNGKFNSEKSLDNETLGYSTASINRSEGYNYKWENILNYKFSISDIHNLSFTGVTSWNHNQSEGLTASATNIPYEKFSFHYLESGSTSANSSYSMSKGMSYVARLNYSYLGRYLLTVSNRLDGSSRLSEGNKWDSFPAAAVAWRISDEPFMEGASDYLTNLKLRVSYGTTGNSQISTYGTVATVETGSLAFGNTKQNTYYFGNTLANEKLGWEKSYSTNIGVDLGLFNNRINLVLDLYDTDTDDILYKRTMPTTMGGYLGNHSSMWQNVCETNNKGVEIALTTRNIENDNFSWSSNVTFGRNKEEITKLVTEGEDIIDNDAILSVGHPVNSFYNYKFNGIWQSDESDESALYGMEPGDIKLVDVTHTDGDGNQTTEYTTDDKTILGHENPDWTLGFKNNFTYRNFDLSIFAYARWGQTINYEAIGTYDPRGIKNSPAYFNYWTPENPSNDFPRPNANKNLYDYFGYESLNYIDGSFFKIKNITLGYSIPQATLDKMHINKFRVYATVSNAFVFAKSDLIEDYDPELGGSTKFPLTKQVVIGVNVTF